MPPLPPIDTTYTQVRDHTGEISMTGVIRDSDGAYIPFADGNRDYEIYKLWLASGGEPYPPPTPDLPKPTPDPIAALANKIDDLEERLANVEQELESGGR